MKKIQEGKEYENLCNFPTIKNNAEIVNPRFVQCIKYINIFSEIKLYRYIENIIYGLMPEDKIKKHYKELESLGEEEFVNKIRKLFPNKSLVTDHVFSRKNIKDIMIETFAIKTGKNKEEINKIKMLILLKKITTKNITFKNGEIENIDY